MLCYIIKHLIELMVSEDREKHDFKDSSQLTFEPQASNRKNSGIDPSLLRS